MSSDISTGGPIISRYLRLKRQVLDTTCSEPGLTFEGLIDALLVLYEECNNDKYVMTIQYSVVLYFSLCQAAF